MKLAIIIIFELGIMAFCVWGILHKKKLMAFEAAIAKTVRRWIRDKKKSICARWISDEGFIVEQVSSPVIRKEEGEALVKLILEET